ncbi:MAG TPA: MerR family transcriptional regulator [Micromonosporaceae bacterium]|jgi:DNA-binding transcriptional MerR regulator
MRIAELSRRSGVSAPTIKFYVREGLLPAGERTSHNQVRYSDTHLHRLRLVRALIDVGGLSIAATKAALAEIETPGRPLHGVLGVVHRSLAREHPALPEEQLAAAQRDIDQLAQRRGWRLTGESPALRNAVDALATMRQLGLDDLAGILDEYAAAAEQIAAAELDLTVQRAQQGDDVLAEKTAIGIVVGGALVLSLLGLAQEDASARRFPPPAPPGAPSGTPR